MDDEEVVLINSELHKHIQSNNIGDLAIPFLNGPVEHSKEASEVKNSFKVQDENINVCRVQKFEFTEKAGNIIYIIFKTGLMYPDHIIDLENKVDIQNARERNPVKKHVGLCCLGLFASSSVSIIMNKTVKVLYYIGLATAAYFSCKMYYVIKDCFDSRKIKQFASTLEQLFLATKKTLTLIIESEFLLRSKVVKEQSFYVPSNGWVKPSSYENLKCSGLLVPELRKTLLSVYLDAVVIFEMLLEFMKTTLALKSDCDKYNLEPLDEYVELQKQNILVPGSDDLKKLSNMYLVIQSEFLYHFILCFIERLWVNKSSHYNLDCIVTEVMKYVDRFIKHVETLELLYQKCINELKSNSTRIRDIGVLKSCNANDKLYTFIKNFLTKADAHMLSLLLDLRMINDWVNEFEENNKDSSECSNELIVTLHERLELMKSNVQCFSNLYNDNCNILKSMIHPTLENSSSNDLNAPEVDLNSCVRLTGIEVGKSNFDFAGRDEVLISLSNADNVIELCDVWNDDSEDFVSQRCLPKSVLDELKFALNIKKKEWLEREKKATLNSGVTIDNLDFDNLLHSDEQDCKKANVSNDHKCSCRRKLAGKSILETDDSRCSSDEEECSSLRYTTATHITCKGENDDYETDEVTFKCNDSRCLSDEVDQSVLFTTAAHVSSSSEDMETNAETECNFSLPLNDVLNSSKIENSSVEDCNSYDYDSTEEVSANNSICKFSTPKTFVDQIKYAQKSFNLNMTEEEFLGDCSDEEIKNDM